MISPWKGGTNGTDKWLFLMFKGPWPSHLGFLQSRILLKLPISSTQQSNWPWKSRLKPKVIFWNPSLSHRRKLLGSPLLLKLHHTQSPFGFKFRYYVIRHSLEPWPSIETVRGKSRSIPWKNMPFHTFSINGLAEPVRSSVELSRPYQKRLNLHVLLLSDDHGTFPDWSTFGK